MNTEKSSLFGQAESTLLDFNNGQVVKKDDTVLYSLFGDLDGNLKGRDILSGDNIILYVYSEGDLEGTLLKLERLNFTIV